MNAVRILLLPGWQNSGPSHWQSRWQAQHSFERVEQDDWWWPRRGDWMTRLQDSLLADDRPAVLVAHSLGCHLVAAWAAHARQVAPQHLARVVAALLVAPPDLARAGAPPQLQAWAPAARAALPALPTLGACRAWGGDSENRPQRGQFLPDLQPHSPAMGQKDGEKWTAAVDSQPTLPKPDRLLDRRRGHLRPASQPHLLAAGGDEPDQLRQHEQQLEQRRPDPKRDGGRRRGGDDPRNRSWTRPSGPLRARLGRRDNAAGYCLQGEATTPGVAAAAQSGA